MVLRKITDDDSARYIPIIEKTKKKQTSNQKNIIAGSLPRKQKSIFHKTIKNSLKNGAASGFGILK